MTTGSIQQVAVIGAGYMGGGIAQCLAVNGIDVVIADRDPQLTARSFDRLVAETETLVGQGLFPEGAVEQLKAHLTTADSIADAVIRYAAALHQSRLSDVVSIPTADDFGVGDLLLPLATSVSRGGTEPPAPATPSAPPCIGVQRDPPETEVPEA